MAVNTFVSFKGSHLCGAAKSLVDVPLADIVALLSWAICSLFGDHKNHVAKVRKIPVPTALLGTGLRTRIVHFKGKTTPGVSSAGVRN